MLHAQRRLLDLELEARQLLHEREVRQPLVVERLHVAAKGELGGPLLPAQLISGWPGSRCFVLPRVSHLL